MRRFPYEDKPRDPSLIERRVGWVLNSQSFNVLSVLASTGLIAWSSWKALAQMAASS